MPTGGYDMDLTALVDSQISADRRRGFQVKFDNDTERVAQLEKDLVGLVGEVGEFANVLKKVRLVIDHEGYEGPSLKEVTLNLREELADALIYIMRLSVVLEGDLETDLVHKMRVNDDRYGALEKN
jgi:NTP pyrophosphatase (non-canonical NTP hydrolase)